jgi:predicted RNase H-like nuclease (RuvC/YqgF family)
MNELPLFVQIMIAIGGVLGAKELIFRTYDYFLGKPQATAKLGIMSEEQRQLHLTNEGTKLDQMAEITKRMEELIIRSEQKDTENAELRQRLRTEERRVIERTAVIGYQKDEINNLHDAITTVREEMAVLRANFETLSAAHELATQANMRLTAKVDALESAGAENGTTDPNNDRG